jgi:hypothetical protein
MVNWSVFKNVPQQPGITIADTGRISALPIYAF